MKIVFLGTPDYIEPVIEQLNDKFNLQKVVRNPKQLNNEIIEQLKNLSPDFFVVASFGKILSNEIINIPRHATLNIHPSLLPKYRGSTPIQTAILNGDKTTGVSIIKMDEELDHGPILGQKEFGISEDDTFLSLAKRLFRESAKMLPDVINRFDQTTPELQDESEATYTKLLTREDGYIDPSKSLKIKNLKLKIRAYYPWPGVWTKFDISNSGKDTIIKILPDEKLQVEGKSPMSYKDFINGYPKGKILLEKLSLI